MIRIPEQSLHDQGKLLKRTLALAAHGFYIFPVVYDTKISAVTDWPNIATRDIKQITEWFDAGKYNIGIHGGKFKDRRMVVLDVDVKNDKPGDASLDLLQLADDLPDTMTNHTPTGGRHLFFQTDETYRNSAGALGEGLDIRATGGYVVGPGSYVGGDYHAALAPIAELPSWLGDKIKRAKPKKTGTDIDEARLDTLTAIERATTYLNGATVAVEGHGGDATTYAVACTVFDFGMSVRGCLDLMLAHWNHRCEPPWNEDELMDKVRNARKYRETAVGSLSGEAQFSGDLALPDDIVWKMMTAQHKPLGAVLSIADVMNRPTPRQIVRHIWPEKGVALLAGESRHMKTFVVLSLAMSVATGARVGDLETIEKTILFTLNEGQSGFGLRCQGWLDHHQIDREEVNDKFAIMENTVDLMRAASIDNFFEVVEAAGWHPQVVIIDTFSKATLGADDNSTMEMATAISGAYRIADRWGGLVVLIDHVGKDAKRGVRGAYAKFANVDAVSVVRRKDKDVTLFTDKMKDGEDGKSFAFRIEMQAGVGEGDGVSVPVIVPATMSVLPAQPTWVVDHLVINGQTGRDELGTLFCKAYDTPIRVFRAVLSRLVRVGDVAEKDGILSYNRVDF